MGYRIEQSESVDAAVRRIAGEQVEGAIADIDGADADVETAIHEVRKRCKKVRGLLRLVRPWLGSTYALENAWFRDTARRLSGMRDLHVMGRTFDALCERYADECATVRFRAVRERLLQRRAGSGSDPETARGLLDEARPALESALGRIARWQVPADGFEAVEPGLRLTYRRGRKAMAAVQRDPAGTSIHEWRKRAKYHWYHARLLVNCWQPVMAAWSGEADRLADGLGDAHDLVVLRQTLATDVEMLQAEPGQRAVLDLIDRRQREMLAEAFAVGRRLYAERPRSLSGRLGRYWQAWRGPGEGRAP